MILLNVGHVSFLITCFWTHSRRVIFIYTLTRLGSSQTPTCLFVKTENLVFTSRTIAEPRMLFLLVNTINNSLFPNGTATLVQKLQRNHTHTNLEENVKIIRNGPESPICNPISSLIVSKHPNQHPRYAMFLSLEGC